MQGCVPARQRGVALVVSLLFLFVVTLVSLIAANNSSRSTKMAANMQDLEQSFEAAEAGAQATLNLVGTAFDPFRREDVTAPLAGIPSASDPLRNLPHSSAVAVDVRVEGLDLPCPRSANAASGSSVGIFECEYYRIESAHDEVGRSRTEVRLGVVKTVIRSSGR